MEARRRSELFREVNDRILELLVATDADLPGEFLCECGDQCDRRVELAPAAFGALRSAGQLVRASGCGPGRFFGSRRTKPLAGGVPVLS